jgi:glyoxylate carboligase
MPTPPLLVEFAEILQVPVYHLMGWGAILMIIR